jgi:alpha-glucosidase (family GH31 glycosyl hydrolase)
VDLETIPLFVRAGAVLPMGPVRQYTSEKVDGPTELFVHPGANGAFSLYEDDGRSFDFRTGAFQRIDIAWNDRARTLSVRPRHGSATMSFLVHVVGESVSREVRFRGAPLEVKI